MSLLLALPCVSMHHRNYFCEGPCRVPVIPPVYLVVLVEVLIMVLELGALIGLHGSLSCLTNSFLCWAQDTLGPYDSGLYHSLNSLTAVFLNFLGL